MPNIVVTKRAKDLVIAKFAGPGFEDNSVEVADGLWRIPLGEHTMERLNLLLHPGESWSDLFERIATGGVRN